MKMSDGDSVGFSLRLLAAVMFFLCTTITWAEPTLATSDLLDMPLEKLLEVECYVDISRQSVKFDELSTPVSIITAEDIHYSGCTRLPEILQFVPGMDVIKVARNRSAVGIHGLHGTVSDRITLLINGRLADNRIYGGADFVNLPILLEDIERIEIARSPASASWGTNAFTGTINIVTKKPKDMSGVFCSSTITEYGDSYTHLRWADKKGRWSWKISTGYEEFESSEDAIDGDADFRSFINPAMTPLIGLGTYNVRDFGRSHRFDSEAVYEQSEDTKWSFGYGQSHLEYGSCEIGGVHPDKDNREDTIRAFARMDRVFDDGGSGYLQWYGNYWDGLYQNVSGLRTFENTLEGQLNYAPFGKHQISIGGNLRWSHINSHIIGNSWFDRESFDEYEIGGFFIDRYKASEQLTFESQIRVDWYNETQSDWSGRITALYSLDDSHEQIIRISAAKAFSSPLSAVREMSANYLPFMGLNFLQVRTPSSLNNEQTYSLELGYKNKLRPGLTFRLDTYFQRFEEMIDYTRTTNLFTGETTAIADNIGVADSWGADIQLELKRDKFAITGWYSYNDFKPDHEMSFQAFRPAQHKAGITSRINICDNLVFNTNYKFTNTTKVDKYVEYTAPVTNQLDLTISSKFAGGNGEIMVGVSDLFNKTREAVADQVNFIGHEVPGRTYFVRIQLKF